MNCVKQSHHYSMETALALPLSKKVQTPLAHLVAAKDSTLMVQPTEHVRLITNGIVLWLNVKVS